MSRVPRNVQLLQQQNDTLHQAAVHSKALTLGNTQAAWAQRDFQVRGCAPGTLCLLTWCTEQAVARVHVCAHVHVGARLQRLQTHHHQYLQCHKHHHRQQQE